MALVDKQSAEERNGGIYLASLMGDRCNIFLKKWKMPVIVTDAVRNHRDPVDGTVDPLLVSAVHISDIIAHMLSIGYSGENTVPKFEDYAERQLGIGLVDLDQLVPEIDEQVRASDDLLFLGE